MDSSNEQRTIRVDYLARVEGEGSLSIVLEGDQAKEVRLSIFEPPRFFEGLLRGRPANEAPDITARICGICPVAYQMSACQAVEDAYGFEPDDAVTRLRRLLYCGEWIESHTLHVFMLHAPDFLGFDDAVAMAKDHGDWVKQGLRIKKAGNAIVSTLGGREIHPINVRIGGFYRWPEPAELKALLPELDWAKEAMRDALLWIGGFSFPDFERDYEFVALQDEEAYPFMHGRIRSNRGLDAAAKDYDRYFKEEHRPHSTALYSSIQGGGAYHCGPLARINLNFDRLWPLARETAEQVGFSLPCKNPFRSIIARGLEILQALEEAGSLARAYVKPESTQAAKPRAGMGYGMTEAPRGILYHRYRIDEDGRIEDAKIVPPTSQNQGCIEADLFELAPRLAALNETDATWLAEQAIRNYDPCISCATHFLKLKVDRV